MVARQPRASPLAYTQHVPRVTYLPVPPACVTMGNGDGAASSRGHGNHVFSLACLRALCQLCHTTVPPTALSPSSLAPDVLHLEACSSPSCVVLASSLAINPTAAPQLYPLLGAWRDSKEGQPVATIGLKHRAVSFDTRDPYDCTYETEGGTADGGRYCPNGYIGFHGSCGGYFQDDLTVSSSGSTNPWAPATDPKAPFSIVLISRPTDKGPGTWGADCSKWPQQTFFTTSRDKDDIEDEILWKTRDIVLWSSKTQHALNLRYGVEVPCPALNKWRMEVLTRSVSGTVFFYTRYTEGEEPVLRSFAGRQPVTLGADQLILGVDKRQLDLGYDGEYLNGDIAVLSVYNRALSFQDEWLLAKAYSCRFNLLRECASVDGYTVVAANLDHKGGDLAPGCTSFDSTAYHDIANQGAALCTGSSNCAGFTTFQWGGQSWACPKAALSRKLVAQPQDMQFCLYKKNT